jgi:hypothetical protein
MHVASGRNMKPQIQNKEKMNKSQYYQMIALATAGRSGALIGKCRMCAGSLFSLQNLPSCCSHVAFIG